MGKNDIDALLDFFLYSDLENEGALDEYLEEEGLDFESFYENLGVKIKKKIAELKIEKGKKRINKFLSEIKTLKNDPLLKTAGEKELAIAFHKKYKELTPAEIEELIDEANKLDLLHKIIEDDE